MQKKAIVIGSGFSGLAAATELAHQGYSVQLLEKNEEIGGRARKFEAEGFTFDMGPSWYWMPDVFENYFAAYGKKPSDYYDLIRLSPSYSVFWPTEKWEIPAKLSELYALFEKHEPGSSKGLKRFLADGKYKYEVGMNDLVHKPGLSLLEFLDIRVIKGVFKLHLFTSIAKYIRTFFSNPKLIELLEFPVLFLGAMPKDTPALYTLMNYADMELGTWYPMGGMHKIIAGMAELATEKGVEIIRNTAATELLVEEGKIVGVQTRSGKLSCDFVIATGDYHHIEHELLKPQFRTYTAKYWDERVMAPSSLLFYLGIDKPLQNLEHHNLFFDTEFNTHAEEIYKNPKWPSKPLFYASVPSRTDKSVAPIGKENLFILIPLAPNLAGDTAEMREKYYQLVMDRLEERTNQNIRDSVVYKRSFCLSDFKNDYNAFKGNAYGLANTLMQTAILKPSIKSKRVKGLYFAGQLSVPGPGVPPSLISGKIAAKLASKENPKV